MSALAFLKKVDRQVLRLINIRKVKNPLLTIGIDGGGDQKLVCTMFLHDRDNPDHGPFKDGGWRRSVVLGKGDNCPEVKYISNHDLPIILFATLCRQKKILNTCS